MISCSECIERMKPDDPRVKAGRYHLCGCDYCEKPDYFRDLEQSYESRPRIIYKRRPVDNEIDQLKSGFLHLQNKLNEHLDKSKKRDRI